MPGMPATSVVGAVPDIKTLKKDLKLVGIELAVAQGRRLDFHGLRHTFHTLLDRTQCSRVTKKKLMRHANEDVTDGYGHAELAEMLSALVKLSFPMATPQRQIKTGTDVTVEIRPLRADHQLDHRKTAEGQLVTANGKMASALVASCPAADARYNPPADVDLRLAASSDDDDEVALAIVGTSRPDTQVD